MLASDREEFVKQMRVLCAGKGVPVGDREEAYWRGLAKMSLLEFGRVVDFALGEDCASDFRMPSTGQCWTILRNLRARDRVIDRRLEQGQAEIPYTPTQILANQLLTDWLIWRVRTQCTPPITEVLARQLYSAAHDLAGHALVLVADNDPDMKPKDFVRSFCDQVLAPRLSEFEAQRYREDVLKRGGPSRSRKVA